MDRIQLIPDILDEIVSYLQIEELASLVRTSRPFFFPATAKLWCRLAYSNGRTLLPALYEIKPEPQRRARTDRLMWYRDCVRRVDVNFVTHYLKYQLARSLEDLPYPPPVFPLATAVVFNVTLPSEVHDIKKMLTANPLDITICIDDLDPPKGDSWHVFLRSLLTDIAAAGGFLEKLEVVTPFSGIGYFNSWIPMSQSGLYDDVLPTLLEFKAPMGLVDVQLLATLARAPLLRHIEVRPCNEDPGIRWDALSCHTVINNTESFASMRFAMFECDISSLAVVMACIKGPLDEPQLMLTVCEEYELPCFATAMASIPSSVTKFYLHLDDVWDANVNTPLRPFSFELLETLYRCSGMSEFNFQRGAANVEFDLRDTHLGCLSEAWPDLTSLELGWTLQDSQAGYGICDPVLLTLAGLVPLARNCTKLTLLDINYMSAEVDFRRTLDLPVVPRPQVEVRVGQSSPILDPTALAYLLDSLWCQIELQTVPVAWRDTTLFRSVLRNSRSLQTKTVRRRRLVEDH